MFLSIISVSQRASLCISIRKGLTDSDFIYQDLKLSTRIRGAAVSAAPTKLWLVPLLARLVHLRQVHPLKVHPLNEKRCTNIVDTPFSYSVGGDGFEPPKASPADLQSAPFGHSGNHPTAFVLKASAKVQINFDNAIALLNFF